MRLRLRFPLATALVVVVTASAACGGGSDAPLVETRTPVVETRTTLTANMNGDQEPSPTATGALGAGSLTLSSQSRELSGSITLNGLSATVAHIHDGVTGVIGAVIVPLAETAAGSGTWGVPAGTVLTEAQATAFGVGGLYLNAHSTANPGGEIRCQIGRQVFAAQLSAA